MGENEIAARVLDASFDIHRRLGPGLLESVYEVLLAHRLQEQGLRVARQIPVPISIDGIRFDEGFRADLIVGDRVLIELKSVRELHDVFHKQTLTYIRLLDLRLGLLVNFNESLLKDGIRRIANDL